MILLQTHDGAMWFDNIQIWVIWFCPHVHTEVAAACLLHWTLGTPACWSWRKRWRCPTRGARIRLNFHTPSFKENSPRILILSILVCSDELSGYDPPVQIRETRKNWDLVWKHLEGIAKQSRTRISASVLSGSICILWILSNNILSIKLGSL